MWGGELVLCDGLAAGPGNLGGLGRGRRQLGGPGPCVRALRRRGDDSRPRPGSFPYQVSVGGDLCPAAVRLRPPFGPSRPGKSRRLTPPGNCGASRAACCAVPGGPKPGRPSPRRARGRRSSPPRCGAAPARGGPHAGGGATIVRAARGPASCSPAEVPARGAGAETADRGPGVRALVRAAAGPLAAHDCAARHRVRGDRAAPGRRRAAAALSIGGGGPGCGSAGTRIPAETGPLAISPCGRVRRGDRADRPGAVGPAPSARHVVIAMPVPAGKERARAATHADLRFVLATPAARRRPEPETPDAPLRLGRAGQGLGGSPPSPTSGRPWPGCGSYWPADHHRPGLRHTDPHA